ncbi:hypothetical protein [Noviherbaspirillum sp.]|uniref:hypothetical protein n=1 Tax=Noviherbaspirillum sp. TaxID=1926288 RepID=UPI002FE11BC3
MGTTVANVAETNQFHKQKAKPKVAIVEMTFADSLEHAKLVHARSRTALYDCIAAVFNAYEIGFKDKLPEVRDANASILDKNCKDAGLENFLSNDILQKLAKYTFGNDSKFVSSVVHILRVADKRKSSTESFVNWLTAEGGIQSVRTTYKSDGTKKEQIPKTEGGASGRKVPGENTEDVAHYGEKAREILRNKEAIFTLSTGIAPIVAPLGEETDCTAILRQLADGSFEIKAIVSDKDLTDSAFVSFGRSEIQQQSV